MGRADQIVAANELAWLRWRTAAAGQLAAAADQPDQGVLRSRLRGTPWWKRI